MVLYLHFFILLGSRRSRGEGEAERAGETEGVRKMRIRRAKGIGWVG